MLNGFFKPCIPLTALLLLSTATTADEAKLAAALKSYNEGLAAAVQQFVTCFDRTTELLKNYEETQLKESEKKSSLERVGRSKKRFLETGILPEFWVGSIPLERTRYHETLYALQTDLLKAYDAELDAIKKRGESPKPDLIRDYKRLLSEIPTADLFKKDSVWKGYRYNEIGNRFWYEWTVRSREADKFSVHINFIDKHEWIVEGTVNGPLLEGKIAKVINGQNSTQRFKGIILGNRMLLNVYINEKPQALRLFLQ